MIICGVGMLHKHWTVMIVSTLSFWNPALVCNSSAPQPMISYISPIELPLVTKQEHGLRQIDYTNTGLLSILPQRWMQFLVWLNPVYLCNIRITRSLEQIQPLARSRSYVEAYTLGVVLEQRHYCWSSHFARQRTEESPEFSKPGILEVVDAEERFQFEVDDQRRDSDWQVVGSIAHEQ